MEISGGFQLGSLDVNDQQSVPVVGRLAMAYLAMSSGACPSLGSLLVRVCSEPCKGELDSYHARLLRSRTDHVP